METSAGHTRAMGGTRRRSAYGARAGRIHPLALPIAMLLAGAAGTGYYANDLSAVSFMAALPGSGCVIKGNISINTGERIYHVPGQEHYSETIIRPEFGERWFCSEAAARKAGWRKSRT